jgi:DNA repair ATPase RecN
MVKSTLERLKLDPTSILCSNQSDPPLTLKLKRALSISNPTGRIQSTCSINDHGVTLKVLKAVGAPLLAIVNAPAAAAALGRPKSRMAMIDTGVPSVVVTWVRQLQAKYNKSRRHREKLQKELESRTLPISMNNNGDDDKDLELLRHWIEELDGFEARISNVCQSISLSALVGGSSLSILMEEFDGLTWMDNEGDTGFSSGMHVRLLDLSDHLRSMDEKIEAAMKAHDALASLSLPDSAKTALERTRQLLLDATAGEEMTEDANNISIASE